MDQSYQQVEDHVLEDGLEVDVLEDDEWQLALRVHIPLLQLLLGELLGLLISLLEGVEGF